MTKEELNSSAKIFSDNIEKAIVRIERESGAIVLVSAAVISHIPDYTNRLEKIMVKLEEEKNERGH